MSTEQEGEESHVLSVDFMQRWLAQELKDIDKARELRVKEAMALVEGLSKGELTSRQAGERLLAYEARWGDALHGASALPHLSDEQILAEMDRIRASLDARSMEYHRRMARYAYRNLPRENQR